MIHKTVLTLALLTLCALAKAAPIPAFDIKTALAMPQDIQAEIYDSLTKQWEGTTEVEKEAFRQSMRKQLDTLSIGEQLVVVGQIFAAVGRAKSGAEHTGN